MSYAKKYFSRHRYLVILGFFLGIGTFLVSNWYWQNVCAVNGCDIYFIDAYLAPLREAGLVLTFVTAPFLFLPTHYFKKWLLWIFLPASVFTLITLANLDPNSSNMFRTTREEAMANFMYWWLPLTLLFITVYWYRTRKK